MLATTFTPNRISRVLALLAIASGTGPVIGQDLGGCVAIERDADRLRCYDAAAKRQPAAAAPSRASGPNVSQAQTAPVAAVAMPVAKDATALGRRWELDPGTQGGTFIFRPHRQNYFLPLTHTSSVNTAPYQPSLDALAAAGLIPKAKAPVDATEAAFQLSFKVKVWENVLPNRADLWLGYTQQSTWQVYNRDASSPFRNTDYQPEAMLSLRTDLDLPGLRWRNVVLGFVHQSNGRAEPLSRSWNRVYADFGFERGNFALSIRPWYRIKEAADKDDNPDIHRYMGYGDLTASYRAGSHQFGLVARHNFATGKGGTELDWSFPLYGMLRGYVQLFSGYGYNLLDYNHRQTVGGIGVLLTDRI